MLDGQRMRAARVVVDLGVHLGLPAPEKWGGGNLGRRQGVGAAEGQREHGPQVLCASSSTGTWAGQGQAPSYKIGQRLWEQARADAQAREGAAFDLKTWHHPGTQPGSVPLSVLSSALA